MRRRKAGAALRTGPCRAARPGGRLRGCPWRAGQTPLGRGGKRGGGRAWGRLSPPARRWARRAWPGLHPLRLRGKVPGNARQLSQAGPAAGSARGRRRVPPSRCRLSGEGLQRWAARNPGGTKWLFGGVREEAGPCPVERALAPWACREARGAVPLWGGQGKVPMVAPGDGGRGAGGTGRALSGPESKVSGGCEHLCLPRQTH